MSQVDATDKLSGLEEPRTSLFAVGWLAIAAISMVGWIYALGWLAWRLVDWLWS
ncbi:RNA-binding protein [Bradyrhizobium manausense]|uniref:RNA-binding protein n=1 Tax=Bradyrhizobium manausense TaxID=989370 RepID=UPI0032E025A3